MEKETQQPRVDPQPDSLERETAARYAASQRNRLEDGSKADPTRAKSPFWRRNS